MSSQNQSIVQKSVIGSRLSPELYQSFVNYLDNESKLMPPKNLLVREMTQTMHLSAKKTNNSIRKKFRNWTKRMALSNGVLLHKLTNKSIIPEMKFYHTIKEIHESSPRHLNVTQTVREIKSRFTWSSKNFGMNLTDVLIALSHCQHKKCQKSVKIIKNRLKSEIDLNSTQNSFAEDSYTSKSNEDQSKDISKYFSVDNKPDESVDCIPTEDCTKLFNELMFKIHLMRIRINLFKVHKFKRNQSLKESIQSCEQLIEKLKNCLRESASNY